MFQRTSVASMPARTTGASGASTGQAILAAAQSAFFQQQQAQQSQPQPQQPHGPPPGRFQKITRKNPEQYFEFPYSSLILPEVV